MVIEEDLTAAANQLLREVHAIKQQCAKHPHRRRFLQHSLERLDSIREYIRTERYALERALIDEDSHAIRQLFEVQIDLRLLVESECVIVPFAG